MAYTSLSYLVFLAAICLGYYLIPAKGRWFVLLIGNVIFYAASGWDNLVYLVAAILVSYLFGRRLDKLHELFKVRKKELQETECYERSQLKALKAEFEKRRQKVLVLGLAMIILALGIVKYTNFVLANIWKVQNFMGIIKDQMVVNLIVPMGVSFFTFQIIAYLIDVHKGDAKAQKNFLRYALYISFFPSVVQGPIPRYHQLGTQLETPQKFAFENLRDGAVMILWGFAKKLILAERLSIFVNTIYDNHTAYEGVILAIATVAYSIQIYADFSSCMDIATGSARIFGIHLTKNFLRPYFSRTLPEFWRRWHVTLGNFFKDYVFFPFSISKTLLKFNKTARKLFGDTVGRIIAASLPILLVWILTGIWHGAEWKYVAWGLFHGILIMLSMIFTPINQKFVEKMKIKTDCFSYHFFQMARTFTLCCIGRVFFRANGLRVAMDIFRRSFQSLGMEFVTGGNFFTYGLNEKNVIVVLVAIVVLLGVSILEEKIDMVEALNKQNLVFRWIVIYALFFAVLIFGKYGPAYDPSSFIYEQF